MANSVFNINNGAPLNPQYPASSAWVTAVGATQFSGTSIPFTESAASILNNPPATITSGGGFSSFVARPSWQDAAVTAYLATSGLPTQYITSSGRAYPDVR